MEQIRLTKVVKMGNSSGVIIPKEILTALDLHVGDQVSFGVYSGDVICVQKITKEMLKNLRPRK